MKRIALFGHPDLYYMNLLNGLKHAFEALGVETFVGYSCLDGATLEAFGDQFQPDAIFEIDRFRDQFEPFAGQRPHITWFINHGRHCYRINKNDADSDIIYAGLELTQIGFPAESAAKARPFFSAIDPDHFSPATAQPRYDVSLIAYPNPPFNAAVRDTMLSINPEQTLHTGGLIDAYIKEIVSHGTMNYEYQREFLLRHLELNAIRTIRENILSRLIFLIDVTVTDTFNSCQLADSLLSATQQVALYGSPHWLQWPRYSAHYRGSPTTHRQSAEAYRSARFAVNGERSPVNSRLVEAMACGIPVLVPHMPGDTSPFSVETHFVPGEHYIPADLDHLDDMVANALADPDHGRVIGANAARHVLENHTWRHRAQQIMADFEAL